MTAAAVCGLKFRIRSISQAYGPQVSCLQPSYRPSFSQVEAFAGWVDKVNVQERHLAYEVFSSGKLSQIRFSNLVLPDTKSNGSLNAIRAGPAGKSLQIRASKQALLSTNPGKIRCCGFSCILDASRPKTIVTWINTRPRNHAGKLDSTR